MSEQFKQSLVIGIINTLRLLIFAVLSLAFNKWWIILFSAFFFLHTKDEEQNAKED